MRRLIPKQSTVLVLGIIVLVILVCASCTSRSEDMEYKKSVKEQSRARHVPDSLSLRVHGNLGQCKDKKGVLPWE